MIVFNNPAYVIRFLVNAVGGVPTHRLVGDDNYAHRLDLLVIDDRQYLARFVRNKTVTKMSIRFLFGFPIHSLTIGQQRYDRIGSSKTLSPGVLTHVHNYRYCIPVNYLLLSDTPLACCSKTIIKYGTTRRGTYLNVNVKRQCRLFAANGVSDARKSKTALFWI